MIEDQIKTETQQSGQSAKLTTDGSTTDSITTPSITTTTSATTTTTTTPINKLYNCIDATAPKDTNTISKESNNNIRDADISSTNSNTTNNNNNNNSTSNPLNEHDYCSPNKTSMKKNDESQNANHLHDSAREKRVRKEKTMDTEFTQLSSSEYSSSEAESDQDSEDDDENDPNRPWCICNKPHNDEFMIACDVCEYWYHGNCVGITDSISKKFQKLGKEWFCHDCQSQVDSGVPRTAIPRRIPKKKKKAKVSKITGRRRGRPRKSESSATPAAVRISVRKSTSSIEGRTSTRRNQVKSARSQSYEEFEDNNRLKALIKERKKAFFLKRALMEQQRQIKMKEIGIGRQSVTTPSFGSSLDTLASSTSTPNMSNLPINIKSEHKQKSKPNIVLQIKTKKGDDSRPRLVTTVVKKREAPEPERAITTTTAPSNPLVGGDDPPTGVESSGHPSKKAKTSHNIEQKSQHLQSLPPLELKMKSVDQPPHNQEPKSLPNDPPLVQIPKAASASPPPAAAASDPNLVCWSGTLSMPEVGKTSVKAKPISGNVDFMKDLTGRCLAVCGRISPENITGYIEKLNSTSRNPILLIQFNPESDEDKPTFEKVFEHLYCRNRCAVIDTNSTKVVKDFYVYPIHADQSIPKILNPNQGVGLNREIPNCLLGVMIKKIRPASSDPLQANSTD